MQQNFQAALARILVYEGGKVNNPKDPGGKTNFGITQTTYNAWKRSLGQTEADVYNITSAEVATIYKDEYWNRIEGDKLPSGLDLAVFDSAVNSGVGTAARWLQATLGTEIDGVIGSKTLAALTTSNTENVINEMLQRRLGALQRLTTWSTFGKGWEARISNLEKIADEWTSNTNTVTTSPVVVTILGGDQKANLNDIKVLPVSALQAHVIVATTVVATASAQVGQVLMPSVQTFEWLKYGLGTCAIVAAIAGVIMMIGKQMNDNASNGDAKCKINPKADEGLLTVSTSAV